MSALERVTTDQSQQTVVHDRGNYLCPVLRSGCLFDTSYSHRGRTGPFEVVLPAAESPRPISYSRCTSAGSWSELYNREMYQHR